MGMQMAMSMSRSNISLFDLMGHLINSLFLYSNICQAYQFLMIRIRSCQIGTEQYYESNSPLAWFMLVCVCGGRYLEGGKSESSH